MQRIGADKLKKIIKFIIVPIALMVVLIVIDQITKVFAYNYNEENNLSLNPIIVIKNFFYITYTENSGSAYGLFSDKTWAQTFFKILTVVALFLFYFLFVYAYKKNHFLMSLSVAFITGGTVGNFIDRVAFDKVRDFMSAEFFGERWFGIFNFADLFLTAGVIMIIVHFLFFDENAMFKKKNAEQDISDK